MNFLIPCFLIETLLWAMLCNNNREDQVCANPTNPHPVGRLARPLSSWQSRPRGGEVRLADTRHAECHVILTENFIPKKFTCKSKLRDFCSAKRTEVNKRHFFISRENENISFSISHIETRREFLTLNLRLRDETEKNFISISGIETRSRFIIFNLRLRDENENRD